MVMNKGMMSSLESSYMTPKWIVELVVKAFGGPIHFDPCGHPNDCTGASESIRLPRDGLAVEWPKHSNIFCNPPYGRAIGDWVRKGISTNLGYAGQMVFLVPARTDTEWFQDLGTAAQSVCFLRRRLTFPPSNTPAPFPSALVYLSDMPASDFRAAVYGKGWSVEW